MSGIDSNLYFSAIKERDEALAKVEKLKPWRELINEALQARAAAEKQRDEARAERDEARAEVAKLREQLSTPQIFWDAEEMDNSFTSFTKADYIIWWGQEGLIVRIARAVFIPDKFGFRIGEDGKRETFYFDSREEAEAELAKMRSPVTGPSLPQKSLDHIFICRDGFTDIDGTHYPPSADGKGYWAPITPKKEPR